jgi:hypothetical protein
MVVKEMVPPVVRFTSRIKEFFSNKKDKEIGELLNLVLSNGGNKNGLQD